MRNAVIGIVMGLVFALPAAARDGAEIETVIRRQMDAFLSGDVSTAYTFASPGIQQLFETPETFGRMVEEGYPMVWHPEDVRFGALSEDENGEIWQRVYVRDAAGATHALDYRMEQIEGFWRISGVKMAPAPDPAV
ncbi:DUF4864 domain-containing protein [Salipiger abyssi]|uniref:Putative DUF4864 protein n=1 Tax=Salipiger abyssi TaxID=1250539 RepID=A0A1P8URK7_9RHOB|nr:DUF4864 domain-containing protein [Salipiger abyssi]APZ52007.1 putative DUF4864 protein [Salipiger abyssi]